MFQLMGATKPLIVLHPKYIDEIKSHPYLSFEGANRKVRNRCHLGESTVYLTFLRISSLIASLVLSPFIMYKLDPNSL